MSRKCNNCVCPTYRGDIECYTCEELVCIHCQTGSGNGLYRLLLLNERYGHYPHVDANYRGKGDYYPITNNEIDQFAQDIQCDEFISMCNQYLERHTQEYALRYDIKCVLTFIDVSELFKDTSVDKTMCHSFAEVADRLVTFINEHRLEQGGYDVIRPILCRLFEEFMRDVCDCVYEMSDDQCKYQYKYQCDECCNRFGNNTYNCSCGVQS